ncbi:hypothetical protein H0255_19135 [Pectobacterium versatile]|uniref:Hint domain-containing protein n=1 Tax=Pectobacterium versatile TaxID=2488639 RepID=UPI0015E004AB|nr:Hint domain-containing protein [Pectobacterium versatile]MBA0165252.1 hypothetical protein [Pectobacterium versatile]MBN3062302.1 hypothetical protein [Pectobacterium versatile]
MNFRTCFASFLILLNVAAYSSEAIGDESVAERQNKSDLAQLVQESKPGVPYALDLSKAHHYRYVQNQLAKAGHTPASSPQLFQTLETLQTQHASSPPDQQAYSLLSETGMSPESINAIIELGRESTQNYNYTATLISSVPEGTIATALTLQLFDNTTKTAIGTHTTTTQYGAGQDAALGAAGSWQSVPTTTDEVLATGTVFIQPKTGSPVFLNVQNTALAIEVPQSPPVVSAPVQKPGRQVPYILTCLQRSPGNTADCDYGPYGGGSVVQFPMQGSVTYASAVPTTLNLSNASVNFIIWDDASGGGCTLGETSADMLSYFTTNGNTVSWNFANANFGQACFNALTRVDMSFMIAVQTATSGFDKVSAYVTTQGGSTPFDTTEIDYLEFAWGCLTPGTKVRMADGSLKRVEDIEVGDMVLSNQNKKPKKVTSTIPGYEEGVIYVVTDAKGNRVEMTAEHPVLSGKNSVLLARQLKVGTEIYNAEGQTKIVSIKNKNYSGKVWNLVLEGEDKNDHTSTGFYAENILVGDNSMQEYWGKYYRKDHDDILQRLPKEWHADYKNWKKETSN